MKLPYTIEYKKLSPLANMLVTAAVLTGVGTFCANDIDGFTFPQKVLTGFSTFVGGELAVGVYDLLHGNRLKRGLRESRAVLKSAVESGDASVRKDKSDKQYKVRPNSPAGRAYMNISRSGIIYPALAFCSLGGGAYGGYKIAKNQILNYNVQQESRALPEAQATALDVSTYFPPAPQLQLA